MPKRFETNHTMKNAILLPALVLATSFAANAQKFSTRSGNINFFSKAPMEDIEAKNHNVTSIVDLGSKEIVFSVLMKSFEFEKALMQEHFNEKYVHSDKYPSAKFKGKIIDAADLTKTGPHNVTVEGELDMHGVVKKYTAKGTLDVSDAGVKGKCKFNITLADHKIEIPGVVADKIAKTVEVTVDMDYKPMNK